MSETTEKRTYNRLPLNEKGELIKNNFGILSPRNMVIVKYPKSGSTFTMCDVPKFLIADSEGGTNYFKPNNKVLLFDEEVKNQFVKTTSYGYIPKAIFDLVDELYHVNKMEQFFKLKNELEKERDPKKGEYLYNQIKELINHIPFPIFALDTITSTTDLSNDAALYEWKKNFPNAKDKETIKKVDDFGGVQYIRRKFAEIKSFIENNAAPFIQYHGHVGTRKKTLKKNDEDINALDIALDGVQSIIFTSKADSVATFYRDAKGCWLDFGKKEETDLGTRPTHLANAKIKIADILSDEDIRAGKRPKTYWSIIYPEIDFGTKK